MSAFFFHDANFLFTAAVGIVLLLFLIELTSIIIGTSLLGIFDDIPDTETDIEASSSFLSTLVNGLALNRVPIMIWFILFLTLFASCGLLINALHALYIDGRYFSILESVPVSMIVALLLTGPSAKTLAKFLPTKKPIELCNEDFIGVVAEITIGVARSGTPAEAKLRDKYGHPHYLLVEPFEPNESFSKGEKVILVKKSSHSWLVTRYA
ncbi:OB-fold-containig protein [Alteromonas sp. 14N.309.X.WAT.G.H12]|uniref:OB-fold-containig protein n=1 Tax=Alteromonas sp. 14N.309.X.WAT.G.H12 TaxID=3120824 RepID=UPI002FD2BB50